MKFSWKSKAGRQIPKNRRWLNELVKEQLDLSSLEAKNFLEKLKRKILPLAEPKVSKKLIILWLLPIIIGAAWYYVFISTCPDVSSVNSLRVESRSTSQSLFQVTGLDYVSKPSLIPCSPFGIANLLPSFSSSVFANQLSVHIGIASIIVALLIFIAESMRDGVMLRSRVLVRESSIFLLVLLEIIGLLLLPYLEGTPFLPDLLVIGICITILAYISKTLRLLYDKKHYEKKRREYVGSLVGNVVVEAARHRVGNGILLQMSQKGELPIKIKKYSFDDQNFTKDYYAFSLEGAGVIEDINLAAIQDLAAELSLSIDKGDESSETQEAPSARMYIAKAYLEHFPSRDDSTALFIHRSLIDGKFSNDLSQKEEKIAEIQKIVRKAGALFRTKDRESPEEEWDELFSELKDAAIRAIEQHQIGEVQKLMEIYLHIANTFTEKIRVIFRGTYDSSQAKEERKNVFYGWDLMSGLKRDMYELSDLAFKTGSIDIIRRVVYTPVQIIRDAMTNDDHYVFQEFIGLPTILYGAGKREQQKEIQNYLIDRSWRYLKEICDVYVEPKLRKASGEELIKYRDFALHFLLVFQNLLKTSYDAKDFDSFGIYLEQTLDLFDQMELDRVDNEIRILERMQKSQDSDHKKLEEQRDRLIIHREIRRSRAVMIFGLAAHILSHWRELNDGNIKDKEDAAKEASAISPFYELLENKLHTIWGGEDERLQELTEIFDLSLKAEFGEDFWGWMWWETKADGRAHVVPVRDNLESLFTATLLNLLSKFNKPEDVVKSVIQSLPPNRDLSYFAEEGKSFMNLLGQIEMGTIKIFPSQAAGHQAVVEIARIFIKGIKTKWDVEEHRQMREGQVSSDRLSKFKKEVIESFYEHAAIRDIFKVSNNYTEKLKEEAADQPEIRFGLSVLIDKPVFFDQWHVHYFDWGDGFGRDLAQGENTMLLADIAGSCTDHSPEEINEVIKSIKMEDPIFISSGGFIFDEFENKKEFIPQWQEPGRAKPNSKSFVGWFRLGEKWIEIFSVFGRNLPEEAFLLDRAKMGSVVQYSPLAKKDLAENVEDIFLMEIIAFSNDTDLLNKFLADPPAWLVKKFPDKADQKAHLLEHVRVRIYQRVRYEPPEDAGGYRFIRK